MPERPVYLFEQTDKTKSKRVPASGSVRVNRGAGEEGWLDPTARAAIEVEPGATVEMRANISSSVPAQLLLVPYDWSGRAGGEGEIEPRYDLAASTDLTTGGNRAHVARLQIPDDPKFETAVFGIDIPEGPLSGQVEWAGKETLYYPPDEAPPGAQGASVPMLTALGLLVGGGVWYYNQ